MSFIASYGWIHLGVFRRNCERQWTFVWILTEFPIGVIYPICVIYSSTTGTVEQTEHWSLKCSPRRKSEKWSKIPQQFLKWQSPKMYRKLHWLWHTRLEPTERKLLGISRLSRSAPSSEVENTPNHGKLNGMGKWSVWREQSNSRWRMLVSGRMEKSCLVDLR